MDKFFTLILVTTTLLGGCGSLATYSQLTANATHNRQQSSIMNAESAAYGQDSARCGKRFKQVLIGADADKYTEATTDYDSSRGQYYSNRRYGYGRQERAHRETFFDQSTTTVRYACVLKGGNGE